MRPFSVTVLLLTVLCGSTSGAAQEQGFKLEPGARVRIVSPTFKTDDAMRIVAVWDDSLQFRSEKHLVSYTLPLNQITALEISAGSRRRTQGGAAVGVLAGATIGGVLGYVSYNPCGDCWFGPSSASQSAVWGGIAAGTVGLLVGTTIGFFSKSERWRRIPLDRRVTIVPSPRGGAVTIAHAF